MAGRMARREAGAMPLRIVTDEATPPNDPPRPCPRGLQRLSPAAVSRRLGQYRRGYSHFACSLRQTKIIRNVCGVAPQGQPIIDELRKNHGHELEHWWKERFGSGYECLTHSEGIYLRNTETAERIRDRIAAASEG